jgi:hypothetical protein
MNDEKIREIAALAGCTIDEATPIIDPDYTYWSERGDSTHEEHMDFLAGPASAIADWVRSILTDMRDELVTR